MTVSKKIVISGSFVFLAFSAILFENFESVELRVPRSQVIKRKIKFSDPNNSKSYRNYFIYVPKSFDSLDPTTRRLLFVLHGGGGTAQEMPKYTHHLEALSEGSNTIVVYPQGYDPDEGDDKREGGWNDGRNTDQIAAQLHKIDDLGFLTRLIDKLSNKYSIPPRHSFFAGVSNGGFMAFRMACERADRVAGIANVVGSMASGLVASCKPSTPVSALSIIGSADPTIDPLVDKPGFFRVAGFTNETRGYAAMADVALQVIGRPAGCSVLAYKQTNLPDVDLNDSSQVTHFEYNCPAASKVKLEKYLVNGGGHQWPGGEAVVLPPNFIQAGPVNRDISASEIIWKFFSSL